MAEVRAGVIDCYAFRRAGATAEVLTLRRAETEYLGGTWQAVHGKIEPGERAWQTALRELREETGLVPLRFWQLESVNMFYVARADRVELCPCFAAEVAADAVVHLNEEHSDSRWVEIRAAAETFMWPGQRRSLREIIEDILQGSAAEPALRIALP